MAIEATQNLNQQQWRSVKKDDIPPYEVFTKHIERSENDDRDYRLIRLENGLEAIIIQDAGADKAAASLDVAVGHLHDPDDMPGLAHFCEHLLFMGTEQYPRENEYSEYLAKNNGYSNAFTGTTNTNYFFTVSTSALSGALSRFSAFFHSPLFAPSCTVRELNAVDSEHKKNHQNDIWRIFQLNKHLSKDGHPWRKFGSGNKDSLTKVGRELKAKGLLNGDSRSPSLAVTPEASRTPSPLPNGESGDDGGVVGRETRRRLVEWWSKEYSANRMRLCVIGKESVEELSDMVSKLFSPIANRGVDPLPAIKDHPFGPNEKGTSVSVSTVMSFHAIEISFPIPYQPPFWRHQPAYFLGHFVGHEGPGSLHSYLKHKGWIIALSAGPQPLAREFSMFKVTLRLTKEGFDHHREVSLAVFKYLNLLRSSQFPRWYQHEISTIRALRFRFQEKRRPEDYALWVAEQMAWPVPREKVISAPQLVEDWDVQDPMKVGGGEKEVREILDMLTVENARSVLMAKQEEHERIAGGKLKWEHEPWYGTPYTVERYKEDFVKEARSPNDVSELRLPGPNEFVPEKFDVDKKVVDQPEKRPRLIRETPLSSLWHKKDDQFWVPKAQVIIEIRTPVANESPRASALTRLFTELVTDSLTEFSYDADLAGLSYSFSSHNLGVYVTLSGYNDKLHVLAKDIFERTRNLVISPERLHAKKQELKRDWENWYIDQPFKLSDYYTRYLLTDRYWLMSDKLQEIPSITPEELQAHIDRLLSQVNIRALIVGNMYKDEAIHLIEMTEQILKSNPLPSDAVHATSLILPPENFVCSLPVPNPQEPNSSITYYTQFGSLLDAKLRVTVALLVQIISEPAFNVLRTREQLGYIVACTSWSSFGESHVGLRIIVQSERGPVYLESRVNAFFDEMKEKLETLSDEEFRDQKQGLEKKWKEKFKNLSEETNTYWQHVDTGYLDFMRREINAEVLQTISKDDVVRLFNTHVHPSSPTRAKLSIHMKSQKPRPKKLSTAALDAFSEYLTKKGVEFDVLAWKEEISSNGEPTAEQIGLSLKDRFKNDVEGLKEVLNQIPELVERYPALEEEESLPQGVTVIDNPASFKSTLKKSDPPRPLVEWGDLPTSKY
ncbi:insulin-degrading enzyme [Panus rudis PR-1116 ss-1]|nr:insulin-degrading enzyme [Panus rudis PR-1116 ss-1]